MGRSKVLNVNKVCCLHQYYTRRVHVPSVQVFALGHENRSTGATKMNIQSSRSHALLCITVMGVNKTTGVKTIGRSGLDCKLHHKLTMSNPTQSNAVHVMYDLLVKAFIAEKRKLL